MKSISILVFFIAKYSVSSPQENGDNHLCIIDTLKNMEWK